MKIGPSIRLHGGAGDPLLLLHPFALCADAWRPILPALVKRHELLVATFPGHMGGDPVPAGFRHSIETSVDLAEAELDAVGIDKVHIAGNSLGGWFALELARRGRAKSVVAISPGGGWERGSFEERELLRTFHRLGRLIRMGGPIAPVLGRIGMARNFALKQIVAYPERLTREEAAFLIRAPYRCEAFYDVLAQLPREPEPRPIEKGACPVRIVWGTEDRLLPMRGYSERWKRLLPWAEWIVLHGAGHVPMYDDPEHVADLILDVTAARHAPVRPSARPAAAHAV
ncbi:MAG TPA: alpha/beta hydrolase [Polyangiaceae bacterium]|nr:alpha/beta hydrolase [Polyangiaceae bacterium]